MTISKSSCAPVLVVDDEESIRVLLEEFLKLEGYSTISASNGKEALTTLKTEARPCIILLDMMMPVMNGRDFLKALLADGELCTIPVVFVSAFEIKDTEGAIGVIKKPVDINKLMKLVAEYCSSND